MVDFNHFVNSLGPHASKYTEDELRQLHGEVIRFATLLLEARAKRRQRRHQNAELSTGSPVDDTDRDRTLET